MVRLGTLKSKFNPPLTDMISAHSENESSYHHSLTSDSRFYQTVSSYLNRPGFMA